MTKHYSTAGGEFITTVADTGMLHAIRMHSLTLTSPTNFAAATISPTNNSPLVHGASLQQLVAALYRPTTVIGPGKFYTPRTSSNGPQGIPGTDVTSTNGTSTLSPPLLNSSQLTMTFRCVDGKLAKFVLLDTTLGGSTPYKLRGISSLPSYLFALANELLTGAWVSFNGSTLTTFVSASLTYNERLRSHYKL